MAATPISGSEKFVNVSANNSGCTREGAPLWGAVRRDAVSTSARVHDGSVRRRSMPTICSLIRLAAALLISALAIGANRLPHSAADRTFPNSRAWSGARCRSQ